jgi:hypothetical protein
MRLRGNRCKPTWLDANSAAGGFLEATGWPCITAAAALRSPLPQFLVLYDVSVLFVNCSKFLFLTEYIFYALFLECHII